MSDQQETQLVWKVRPLDDKDLLFSTSENGSITLPKGAYSLTVEEIKLPSRHILIVLDNPKVIIT